MTTSVAVVEDSEIAAELLRRIIDRAPDLDVVGVYHSVDELLRTHVHFDVCTLDLLIRERSGLSAITEIAARAPVVVVSDAAADSALAREAIGQGAFAFECKATLREESGQQRLRQQIRDAARGRPPTTTGVVLWVGSTGATRVYEALAHGIATLTTPQVILQHLPADSANTFVGWLREHHVNAKLAEAGDVLSPGRILVAPAGRHIEFTAGGRILLRRGDAHEGHLPSGTLMLRSAAAAFGPALVAVILSGMGDDGAAAIEDVISAGGACFVQEPTQCIVGSMPEAAMAKSPRVRARRSSQLIGAVARHLRHLSLPPSPDKVPR